MANKDWKIDRKNVSWERKDKKDGYDSRGNAYSKIRIYVFNSPNGWVLRDTSTFENPEISGYFKTKREAFKFAKVYMSKH
jgi:hypothetical protein